MATRKLNPSEWTQYFNQINKSINHSLVTIEILSPDLGDQVEVRWQLLQGFSIDHKENSLIVFTENLNHRISEPKDIYINETEGNVTTIEITDKDDVKQLIRLQDLSRKVA